MVEAGNTVVVYQANLEAKEFPFTAEVLRIKNTRVYLRWELAGGGFTNQWVNLGCCSLLKKKIAKPKMGKFE